MNSLSRVSDPESASMIETILIVEDDPGIRVLLESILDDEGLAVATLDNGSDAVEWLRTCQPAMVILDLQLPKIRGEHVLDVLHALYDGAVPVITMTAQRLNGDAMRARGARAHLSKPFMLDEMLEVVHANL